MVSINIRKHLKEFLSELGQLSKLRGPGVSLTEMEESFLQFS